MNNVVCNFSSLNFEILRYQGQKIWSECKVKADLKPLLKTRHASC